MFVIPAFSLELNQSAGFKAGVGGREGGREREKKREDKDGLVHNFPF